MVVSFVVQVGSRRDVPLHSPSILECAVAACTAVLGNPCDPVLPWYGVSCTLVTERTLPQLWNTSGPYQAAVPGGVTAIVLSANNLAGQIPSSLGPALQSTLQHLDLHSNRLHGVLPQTLLRNMPRLVGAVEGTPPICIKTPFLTTLFFATQPLG